MTDNTKDGLTIILLGLGAGLLVLFLCLSLSAALAGRSPDPNTARITSCPCERPSR